MRAATGITIGLVQAGSSMMARATVTLIYVDVTFFTCEAWCADARAVQAFAVAGASVQAADVGTGILVQFTVDSFVVCQAHALIAVNQVPAGGRIEAGGGETLIVLLLTVQAVVTWVTEAFVAGAHAAASAMSTRAESTEVHEVGTGGPREARAAAAGEMHSIHVAGAIVLAR